MKKFLRRTLLPGMTFFVLLCGLIFNSQAQIEERISVPDLSNADWKIAGPFRNDSIQTNQPGGPGSKINFWECSGFTKDFLTEIGGESKARL